MRTEPETNQEIEWEIFRKGAQRLAISVIISSLREIRKGNRQELRFINSVGFEFWCDVAGLKADFVKDQFAKGKVKLKADISDYFENQWKVVEDKDGHKTFVRWSHSHHR